MKKVMASGTFDLLHPGHVIYLEHAKALGGEGSKLCVVVARDSTVKKRKKIPIVNENQRLKMIKYLKPVDEAVLGNENKDILKIVEEIDPDIIAIGQDQTHNVEQLQKAIDERSLKAKVKRVEAYHTGTLDSTCKIIKKIKQSNFDDKTLNNCK